MSDFIQRMRKTVTDYKENVLGVSEQGTFRGKSYPHILPKEEQPLNLWEGIREDAIAYFSAESIAWHKDSHNDRLLRMGHPHGGERNPLTAWTAILKQPESFVTFTIQDLLNWIDTRLPERLHDWRNFLKIKHEL